MLFRSTAALAHTAHHFCRQGVDAFEHLVALSAALPLEHPECVGQCGDGPVVECLHVLETVRVAQLVQLLEQRMVDRHLGLARWTRAAATVLLAEHLGETLRQGGRRFIRAAGPIGDLDRLQLTEGEHTDDVIRGCLAIALRRASMFSRAPVVHDLTIAFSIWGFLDAAAPTDLVTERRTRFGGVARGHHYAELRYIVDMVPESTLRMTPQQVQVAGTGQWRSLVGLAD